jgi:hypothetical protein
VRSRRASHRVASIVAAVLAVGAAGCGGVQAADLFVVTREGPGPHEQLVLLVNEEGGVTCNGRQAGMLEDPQIIESREIQEDLKDPASEHLRLAPAPGSVVRYRVRSADGTVVFADNSPKQPDVLHKLQLFVLQTAQRICHLPA